ncbi:chromate transporter [Rikenella microfusus]|uniref:Chromate transporter, chromate ion transporter (CHR) family n=1 Tax=Rikenella microfusus TaxID=28139 RepID=A0A379MQ33_9BACT|nr:chromate transporter [Rikenella microfusus]SUE32869.1 chromate transporter, chromate ion transporter (CHR) family [Rikenella microfusus]HJE87552.1 chromate transporter [Rikenella microfusus]
MLYLQLFLTFFKIGLFGFGGGYAMISLIQTEVVTDHAWISSAQFADIIAISQVTPGPIAINSATYIGYTATDSVWGSALATFGVCAPSLIIMLIASRFYLKMKDNPYVAQVMKALRPVVIGLILAAALLLLTPDNFIDWKSYVIFGAVLIAAVRKVSPILLIVLSGAAGWLLY